MRRIVNAGITVFGLGLFSFIASADERPYTQGNVVVVAGVRTEYGHFLDYLKFLATTWKQQQEAAKKAGLIVSYQVLRAQPHGSDDADIYLVTTYKNWAALDDLDSKSDVIATQVYGSVVKASEGAVDRGKIRRAVGSETMQVLNLK